MTWRDRSRPYRAFRERLLIPVLDATRTPLAGAVHGWLDARRGVETRGYVGADALGYHDPELQPYIPSPWRLLPRLLPRREVGPDDVFADLGCGKGRVLLVACRYPFRRVIGVELSAVLAAAARRNLDRTRAQVDQADAREWPVPDDLTVAYFYRPFEGAALGHVLDNLVASRSRRPRRLRLLYAEPSGHDDVVARGFKVLRTRMILGDRTGTTRIRSTLYEI